MSGPTTISLDLPPQTYQALKRAAKLARKDENEVALDAIESYLAHSSRPDALLGLFSNEPRLIDETLDDAFRGREPFPPTAP